MNTESSVIWNLLVHTGHAQQLNTGINLVTPILIIWYLPLYFTNLFTLPLPLYTSFKVSLVSIFIQYANYKIEIFLVWLFLTQFNYFFSATLHYYRRDEQLGCPLLDFLAKLSCVHQQSSYSQSFNTLSPRMSPSQHAFLPTTPNTQIHATGSRFSKTRT